MRRANVLTGLTLLLALSAAGCSWIGGGGGGEVDEPTAEQRRAACDRLAAQAIEAETVTEARRLSARATDCYAAEVERGGGS